MATTNEKGQVIMVKKGVEPITTLKASPVVTPIMAKPQATNIVVNNQSLAQQLAEGKLVMAQMNGQQVVLRTTPAVGGQQQVRIIISSLIKALHHRYQNRELRARESTFIEVNMQLTDAYLLLN